VRRLLVLWDIDFTLVGASGVGLQLYEMVFRDMFGRELPGYAPMAGRTDRAIIIDTLHRAGVREPREQVDEFIARLAALAPAGRELAAGRSRALPGAALALTALARYAPGVAPAGGGTPAPGAAHPDGDVSAGGDAATPAPEPLWVVQAVLTGNVRQIAEVKLSAAGLASHLDLGIGAYGESHEVRAELVHLARANAARRYGAGFAGEQTVLVGDTELDVAAALATGARAVGVATGGTTAGELAAAGAHAVLPDLTDTAATLAAVLGHSPASESLGPQDTLDGPATVAEPSSTTRRC
jgi:phosphoglycolate phosphatase